MSTAKSRSGSRSNSRKKNSEGKSSKKKYINKSKNPDTTKKRRRSSGSKKKTSNAKDQNEQKRASPKTNRRKNSKKKSSPRTSPKTLPQKKKLSSYSTSSHAKPQVLRQRSKSGSSSPMPGQPGGRGRTVRSVSSPQLDRRQMGPSPLGTLNQKGRVKTLGPPGGKLRMKKKLSTKERMGLVKSSTGKMLQSAGLGVLKGMGIKVVTVEHKNERKIEQKTNYRKREHLEYRNSVIMEAAQLGQRTASGKSLFHEVPPPKKTGLVSASVHHPFNRKPHPKSLGRRRSTLFGVNMKFVVKKKGKRRQVRRQSILSPTRTPLVRGESAHALATSENHKLIRQVKLEEDVRSLCAVNDILWEGSRNGTIRLRNGRTGLTYSIIANAQKKKIYTNTILHQSKTVWTGDSRGIIRGYSESGTVSTHLFDRGDQVGIKLLFGHNRFDTEVFWVAGADCNVSVHRSVGCEFIRILADHTASVNSLCLDYYHRYLWSGADDGVRIWSRDCILLHGPTSTGGQENAKEEKGLHSILLPNSTKVKSLCTVDNTVWGGFEDGYIIIWRSSDFKLLHRFKAHRKSVTTIKIIGEEVFTASNFTSEVNIFSIMVDDEPPEIVATLKVPLNSFIVDIVCIKRFVWFGGRSPGALFLYTLPPHSTSSRRKDQQSLKENDVDARTFLKWTNHVLESSDKYNALVLNENVPFADQMSDGIIFTALLDILNPDLTIQLPVIEPEKLEDRIRNVQYIVDIMKRLRIHISEDIVLEHIVGNHTETILKIVWEIIRKYHIQLGYADNQTTETMLKWINVEIAQAIKEEDTITKITNFDWGWYDGYALSALVDQRDPGCIAFGKLEREDPEWNVDTAMTTAEKFGIPKVMDVEDMVYAPCPRSILTYITFFRQTGKQEVDPSVSYVRGPNQENNVANGLSSDSWAMASTQKIWSPSEEEDIKQPCWVEFTVFAVDTMGGPVTDCKLDVTMQGPNGTIVVNTNDNEDGTFTCRYVYPLPPGDYTVDCKLANTSISNCPLTFTVKKSVDPSKSYFKGSGQKGEIILEDLAGESKQENNEFGILYIYSMDKDGKYVLHSNCNVEIFGPNGPVFVQIIDKGNGVFEAKFEKSLIPGNYTISVRLDNQEIKNGPSQFTVKQVADPLHCQMKGSGLLGPDHQTGKKKKCTFTVYMLDKYDMNVRDANLEVRMTNPQGEAVATHSNKRKINGNYIVSYLVKDATISGTYTIDCLVDGKSIKNSPIKFDVKKKADPLKSFIDGTGLTPDGSENGMGVFVIHPRDDDGKPVASTKYNVTMLGPDGEVPLRFNDDIENEDNFDIEVEYDAPLAPGKYTITVELDDQPLDGPPITFIITKKCAALACYAEGPGLEQRRPTYTSQMDTDWTKFTVYAIDDEKNPVLGASCEVKMTDVSNTRKGRTTSIRVRICDKGDGTFICWYHDALDTDGELPPGKYIIWVLVNGQQIKDMPIKLDIPKRADPSWTYAKGPGLSAHKIGSGRSHFDIFAKDCRGMPVFISSSQFEVNISINKTVVESKIITLPEKEYIFNKRTGKRMIKKNFGDRVTHRVFYTPIISGEYTINVTTEKTSIGNLPVVVHLKKGASGSSTTGMHCMIVIDAHDEKGEVKREGGDDFDVEITNEDGENTEIKINDKNNGRYSAEFDLQQPALYTTCLKFNGQEMGISPLLNDLRRDEERWRDNAIVVYAGDSIY